VAAKRLKSGKQKTLLSWNMSGCAFPGTDGPSYRDFLRDHSLKPMLIITVEVE
jgi:hypothetical protein